MNVFNSETAEGQQSGVVQFGNPKKVGVVLTPSKREKFFLHREISMEWVQKLAACGTVAFQVGLILRFWLLLEQKDQIAVTSAKFFTFSISKDQKARALHKMEKAGLIWVKRRIGASCLVGIKELNRPKLNGFELTNSSSNE